MDIKEFYKDKNILIFGLGVNQGGVGSARFFASIGANVRVTDLKMAQQLKGSIDQLKEFKSIDYILGRHRKEDIVWADLIIKNPAVKPGNKYLYYAQKKKKRIETDMGIFFQFAPREQVIGITGTKGKSTTSSLICRVLKENGKKAVLAGNIGTSVLDTIPLVKEDTLVVLEISSFQLDGLAPHHLSPKFAVITNIYPDHLNYYPSMYSYIEAKRLIAQFQTEDDFLFLNRDDPTLNDPKFIDGLNAHITFFSQDHLPLDFNPKLPGQHNRANFAAALGVAKTLGIDEVKALKAMENFSGVEFRLQTVKTWHGVTIINDTTATTPDAGIQALKTYPNSILIAGGMNKKMPYTDYAKTVEKLAKKVFLLGGDSTDQMEKLISKKEIIAGTYDDLKKLLLDVKKYLESKENSSKVVLFSPAATSFNLFQNEFDRGRKFNALIKEIFV